MAWHSVSTGVTGSRLACSAGTAGGRHCAVSHERIQGATPPAHQGPLLPRRRWQRDAAARRHATGSPGGHYSPAVVGNETLLHGRHAGEGWVVRDSEAA